MSAANGIPTLERLDIEGFKSIQTKQGIEIKPLTILAGANSSGKSSMMQPLLLIKQTLESSFDPGALLLSGTHTRFNKASELLSKGAKALSISMSYGSGESRTLHFTPDDKRIALDLTQMDVANGRWGGEFSLSPGEIISGERTNQVVVWLPDPLYPRSDGVVTRSRSFLVVKFQEATLTFDEPYTQIIQSILHLPGLRGTPERTYPVTAVGDLFQGTFEPYTASVIAEWMSTGQEEKVSTMGRQLQQLGLTSKVEARRIDAVNVELQVARTVRSAKRGKPDMVNIADVGFGVSQTLPVLVALLTAKPGQMVYIEQPELHLHPRAQVEMASILADAAKRGVRVIAETHSWLLLLALQTLVAEDTLSPDLIRLYWFARSDAGVTHVTGGELDSAGAYGDFPVDFDDVELKVQQRYLDAADAKLLSDTYEI